MEDLIDMIVQTTGLSIDDATKAAGATIAYLRQKMPAEAVEQLNLAVTGAHELAQETGAGESPPFFEDPAA